MKKEKVKYFKPEVDLVQFEYDDIIATSVCDRDVCTSVEPKDLFGKLFE